MILTVMTYNIAHYNDGGEQGYPLDIREEKAGNLKQMLMETGADLIGIQEDCPYADQEKTLKAADYLFRPVWTFCSGSSGSTIRAKLPVISGTARYMKFSTGKPYRRVAFWVTNAEGYKKRLLFVSAHNTAKTGNSDLRQREYRELFDDINAQQWDWCIITGDFNTTDNADKDNLQSICELNGFDMAIGSYLPWLPTYPGHLGKARQSFDNILVSPGVSIRTTKVLWDWWDKLNSDHVPVIADVELIA